MANKYIKTESNPVVTKRVLEKYTKGLNEKIASIVEDGNFNLYSATDTDIDNIFGNIVDLPELPPITSGGNCDCEHEHEHEMADFDDIDSLFG